MNTTTFAGLGSAMKNRSDDLDARKAELRKIARDFPGPDQTTHATALASTIIFRPGIARAWMEGLQWYLNGLLDAAREN